MRIRMGKLTDCFLSGYTKDGYKSFLAQEISEMQHLIWLKGASEEIRSRLYKTIAHSLAETGIDIELVHQPHNTNLLEGLILKNEKLIIADKIAESHFGQMQVFDLQEYLDKETYAIYESKINDLEEQIRINTELLDESCCNKDMTPCSVKLNQSKEEIVAELVEKYFLKNKAVTHIRFAKGLDMVQKEDYYTEILKGIIHKQYLPSAWQDKNAILTELAKLAAQIGYENTIYYNNWDSENIELLVVPKANLAIAAEKIKDDFVCYSKNSNENLPQDIERILANIKHLQATLADIYGDILATEEIIKAEEALSMIVANCLDKQSEK